MQSLSAASLVDDQEIVDAPLAASDLQIFHSTEGGVHVSDPSLYYAQFPDASLVESSDPSQYPYSMNDFISVPVSQVLLVDEQSQATSSGLHGSGTCRDLHSSYFLQQSHDSAIPSQEMDKILFSPCPRNSGEINATPPSPPPQHSEGTFLQFNTKISIDRHISACADGLADPHAAAFLQDRLGKEKWNIFCARLFERRLHASRNRSSESKSKRLPTNTDRKCGASTVDFLVKVEVVKEVLRTYVPHPYNPLKYLVHAYAGSPTGHVILTRSTILALSGWSNTQFSYWARRVEAVSVLEKCDERIHAIASALKRRLFCNGTQHQSQSLPLSVDPRPEKELYMDITGKGLDTIIDEVKKQTGKSPFLRGKHCSLDPFGSPPDQEGQSDIIAAARVFNATFQAVAYTHTPAISRRRHPRSSSRYERLFF